MTEIIRDLLLGTTLGVALGASIFFAVLFLITFIITSYVYEQTIPWNTKAYLIGFACICVALILASTISLRESIYVPLPKKEVIRDFWDSKYLWQ